MGAAAPAFAQVPGGTSFYDCSFGGTLFDCPLTDRLRARLIAAQIRLCSCPEGSPDRAVTATIDNTGRGIAQVRLYGGRLKLDLTVAITLSGVTVDSVRVNDPLHGTQYWVTKSTFEASWSDFGNQAVIFPVTIDASVARCVLNARHPEHPPLTRNALELVESSITEDDP